MLDVSGNASSRPSFVPYVYDPSVLINHHAQPLSISAIRSRTSKQTVCNEAIRKPNLDEDPKNGGEIHHHLTHKV